MGIHGNGRKSASEKYDSPLNYLNEHIFPIKDSLQKFKADVTKALKALHMAQNKANLQQQKLDWAYSGLEKWRRK